MQDFQEVVQPHTVPMNLDQNTPTQFTLIRIILNGFSWLELLPDSSGLVVCGVSHCCMTSELWVIHKIQNKPLHWQSQACNEWFNSNVWKPAKSSQRITKSSHWKERRKNTTHFKTNRNWSLSNLLSVAKFAITTINSGRIWHLVYSHNTYIVWHVLQRLTHAFIARKKCQSQVLKSKYPTFHVMLFDDFWCCKLKFDTRKPHSLMYKHKPTKCKHNGCFPLGLSLTLSLPLSVSSGLPVSLSRFLLHTHPHTHSILFGLFACSAPSCVHFLLLLQRSPQWKVTWEIKLHWYYRTYPISPFTSYPTSQ